MLEYKSTESFKHIYAKKALQDWFVGAAQDNYDEWVSVAQFNWRVNRGANQDYGIYLEYPIIRESFERMIENEKGEEVKAIQHSYYNGQFDEFFGNPGYNTFNFKNPCVPHYNELKRLGYTVVCVIDAVVMHKGIIKYAFEIVHNHPTPQWKIDILKAADIETYEIGADYVLNMVETPSYIACKRIA